MRSHYYIDCIKRARVETIAMIEVLNGGLPDQNTGNGTGKQ